MPRVLNFPNAIEARIDEKRHKINELESEIDQLERARAVFTESLATVKRRRRRSRKTA